MFVAGAGGRDVARIIYGQRSDLFFRGAIKHKTFAAGSNAINQSTAIGSSDKVSVRIKCQYTDVSFVRLEEDRALAIFLHAINLAPVTGGEIEPSFGVECLVPDVLGFRIEEDFRSKLRCSCACALGCVARESVNLAVGRGGHVDGPIFTDHHRLRLQFLWLKYDCAFAVRSDPIDA